MAKSNEQINSLLEREYQHGFITDIEVDTFLPGLNEDVIVVYRLSRANLVYAGMAIKGIPLLANLTPS